MEETHERTGGAAMTKIDERVIKDLTNLAIDRCDRALSDVLQLVDEAEGRAAIAATVAAVTGRGDRAEFTELFRP
jgi:hypothetical protein